MKKVAIVLVLLFSFLSISTFDVKAATVEISNVVIESGTSLYEVDMNNYNEMIAEGVTYPMNQFKYIILSNGKMFSMQKYNEALTEGGNVPNALDLMLKSFTPDTAQITEGYIDETGKVVSKAPNASVFKVVGIE